MLIMLATVSLISEFGLTNPVVTFRLTLGVLESGLSYNLHIVWTPVLLMAFAWLRMFPKLIGKSMAIKILKPESLES